MNNIMGKAFERRIETVRSPADQTIRNDDKAAVMVLFRCPSCKQKLVRLAEDLEKTPTSVEKDSTNFNSSRKRERPPSQDEIGNETPPSPSEGEIGKETPSPSLQKKAKKKMDTGDMIGTKTPSPFKLERPKKKRKSGDQ